MPSNQTANYALSQWSRTDQVKMDDFNADNAKLDAALKAEADARTALAAEVAKCGNVTMSISTYTGTGTAGANNPTRITFPQMPVFFIVAGDSTLMGKGGAAQASMSYEVNGHGYTSLHDITWSGNTLSIRGSDATRQMNDTKPYVVIGFYTTD